MRIRNLFASFALACTALLPLQAQDFKLLGRDFQVHGFASQAYVKTTGNNWLTMTTTGDGSPGFTDMGLNLSVPVNDSLRISGQVYDRNLGNLGQYHPELDFAVIDYRVRSWLGIRAGRVKTTLGLYTDTQDLDFLHTFAIMPQSVYPLDTRDADIAHDGVDFYGRIPLGHKRGQLAYTAYNGYRSDSIYSGQPYALTGIAGVITKRYGGYQFGGDLRWATPLRGLLVGASRLDEYTSSFATAGYDGPPVRDKTKDKFDFTNQFYGQYSWHNLRIDAEAKRYYKDHLVGNFVFEDKLNVHGWYIGGAYRVVKHVELGSFYSHYTFTSTFQHLSDTSLPIAHDYDKAVTGRIDINRFWYAKVEGHFIDGFGFGAYPNGFYPQQNKTFVPDTNALVLRTGFDF